MVYFTEIINAYCSINIHNQASFVAVIINSRISCVDFFSSQDLNFKYVLDNHNDDGCNMGNELIVNVIEMSKINHNYNPISHSFHSEL